uniref:Group II intron maturase-specific domain-containing protein n=1 Tax=Avrainvillea mazei TaxID=381412 RepID=A0A1X9RPT5_9CHLO|nr:hypothetical protein [Avrainvillea mazei]
MSNSNFIKFISWILYSKKLLKIQSRIYIAAKETKNRKVRNLSRLLIRSRSFQLIIIRHVLKYQFYQTSFFDVPSYFKKLNILQIQIEFVKLINIEYQYFIRIKIYEILWTLALLPINELEKKNCFFSANINANTLNIYFKFCSIFKNSPIEWIGFNKIENFLSKENKIWILNNVLIEKKFFLKWLTYYKKTKIDQNKLFTNKYFVNNEIYIVSDTLITLEKILYNFSIFEISNILNNKKISVVEYANLLILSGYSFSNLNLTQKRIKNFLKIKGLNLKTYYITNLNKGFNFLGWHFSKNCQKFKVEISKENIKSHQLEIKKYLKSSINVPIDKVIFRLNKKIFLWQNYYCYSMKLTKIWKELNNYLFWRIWRWIKKRHRNKGFKWLYKHYWIKTHSNKWVFSNNNQVLFLYKNKKNFNFKQFNNLNSKDQIRNYWKNQISIF